MVQSMEVAKRQLQKCHKVDTHLVLLLVPKSDWLKCPCLFTA